MKTLVALVVAAGAPFALAQQKDQGTAPIYRVTVIERTVKAVNYRYRSGPTKIDFRGTFLLPKGKGDATVESKRGRTQIDASFNHLPASQTFGREYLTYVLWAISPDGRPQNLGEVVPDHSDDAHLRVTSDLQAFAMIVTAEPYSAVRQPGDVVVLENQVRPDTEGRVETVSAKYELLPRGEYTYQVSAEAPPTPKVSMKEYEALSQTYQAQNAINIAAAAHADRYAANTLNRAKDLLQQAQQLHSQRIDSHSVVELSRQATETAEDARLISLQRQQQEKLSDAQTEAQKAQEQVSAAQQAKQQAESEAQQAKTRADALAQQAQADREARNRAEAAAAQARAQASETALQQTALPPPPRQVAAKASALRARVLDDLNAVAPVRDTPRGLVITLPDSDFSAGNANSGAASKMMRAAAILARYPGLQVSVEGYSASEGEAELARQRADGVRRVLAGNGLAASRVTAQGFGDSRPLASNATSEGRRENARVEIVISGASIGNLPLWDKTYSLTGE